MEYLRTDRFIYWLSVTCIALINGLFCLKYSYRATSLYIPVTVFYIVGVVLLCVYGTKLMQRFSNKRMFWSALITFSVCWIVVLLLVDINTLHVDRWLMIRTFWDNIRDGIYPYTPRYGSNIPSQLPIYHILAYPFYVLGEVGLYSFAVVVVWLFFLREKYPTYTNYVILLLCSFTGLWWEVAGRSTILMNMIMVIGLMMYFEVPTPTRGRSVLLVGIVSGLLLATRLTVIFPLIVLFSSEYLRQKKYRDVIIIAAVAMVIVFIVMLPLYLYDRNNFYQYNPLSVQSYFTNTYVSILLIGISLLGGLVSSGKALRYSICGVIMLLTTVWASQIHFRYFGPMAMVFESKFDISYYLQSIPFFMMALLPELRPTEKVVNR